MMSILFEPMVIKGMELKNRFVRSATYALTRFFRGTDCSVCKRRRGENKLKIGNQE